MKVLGLVAEYNPFHYGHKHHLKESLSITNSHYSVAVMSSSFVQRGEPSFVDKWTRSKMAIENGVDLVLELPFVYSAQSAELFALGAVKLLNSLKIVDFISFGSEEGNLEPLKRISKILLEEPLEFQSSLKQYLSLGNSFPVSRSLALQEFLKNDSLSQDYDFKKILKQSNNILGIEYLKALFNTKSTIKPITIKRIGANYKDIDTSTSISSATGIRNIILNKDIKACKELVPLETFNLLKEYILKYNKFNTLGNYNHIIRYLFLTENNNVLKDLLDIDEGLENRIIKFIKENNSIEEIISKTTTKRYPSTRIQRIFIHLLLHLNEVNLKELYSYRTQYIRVLAANKKGLYLLNKIKKESEVKIITKFANYEKYNNEVINKFLYFEKKATDIYFLGLNLDKPLVDMDYYTTPYIK
ncbi:nucleotidyltransferase [Tissierella creatinophila]|uniref:tRNA(Met) cytidine acetate ligase n=1 Tax=Tissierella creatinophila DSM 6911 TaxID=1123403 RepID=A0A1U7M368_TISCR|nr:nucleotidyltransferase [Tissierella creatinophila]OLS01726.1 hypothetical protein TICRE_23260 [Tissierella creatinophila DSM 6911]